MKPSAIAFIVLAVTAPAHADLPMLQEQPWLGAFIGFRDRDARFFLSSKGNAMFEPLKRDGTPIAVTNPIRVKFDVFETLPGGKTVRKTIDDDAFTSDSPATLDPKSPVTIRGTVTGDAKFEITVSEDKGAISLSGRITDKGSLTNPLHLAISIDFLPYKLKAADSAAEREALEKKANRDEIKVELPGRKVETLGFLDTMNPAEVAKDGFSSAEIRTQAYGGMRWDLTATPNSTLRFEDKGKRPLWNGFSITWTTNEGPDPSAGKFTIKHK